MLQVFRDKKIVNKIARIIYKSMGYEVPEGFDFHSSQHPQELSCFYVASDIFEKFVKKKTKKSPLLPDSTQDAELHRNK